MKLLRDPLLWAIAAVVIVVALNAGGDGGTDDETKAQANTGEVACDFKDVSTWGRLLGAEAGDCIEEMLATDPAAGTYLSMTFRYDGTAWETTEPVNLAQEEQSHTVIGDDGVMLTVTVESEAGEDLYSFQMGHDQGTVLVLSYLNLDGVETITFEDETGNEQTFEVSP